MSGQHRQLIEKAQQVIQELRTVVEQHVAPLAKTEQHQAVIALILGGLSELGSHVQLLGIHSSSSEESAIDVVVNTKASVEGIQWATENLADIILWLLDQL